MNMMESNTHFNDAQTQFEYITEFKEKVSLKLKSIPLGDVPKLTVFKTY